MGKRPGMYSAVYFGEYGDAKVAIKVDLPHPSAAPGFFGRFPGETALDKQARHENVVRTLDVDATIVDRRQVDSLVKEHVEGQSLREISEASSAR